MMMQVMNILCCFNDAVAKVSHVSPCESLVINSWISFSFMSRCTDIYFIALLCCYSKPATGCSSLLCCYSVLLITLMRYIFIVKFHVLMLSCNHFSTFLEDMLVDTNFEFLVLELLFCG